MPILSLRGTALFAGLIIAGPAMADPPAMDPLWPNTDGLSWTYSQHYESREPGNPLTLDNRTRLFLDGPATVPDAIDAQYLHQDIVGAGQNVAVPAEEIRDPFMRQLALARPDLRSKLMQRVRSAACPEFHPTGAYSVLLNGEFAYRKTATEIAAWRCNLADTKSWQWLISDLTPGSTFTLQLIPDIASNVFLHGTVGAIEPVIVPAGSFATSVRVDYVIDYGSVNCTDSQGGVTGTARSETRGSIHFVPGEGPVDSYEELVVAEATGNCAAGAQLGTATEVVTMRLDSLPTRTRASTWGRLKQLYR